MTFIGKAKGRVSITLPLSIKNKVSEMARADGVSDSAWMASAVAEKIGSVSAAAFFESRARGGSAKRGLALLKRAGTQPPRRGDERS
jgi:predicted transcriptional regulator